MYVVGTDPLSCMIAFVQVARSECVLGVQIQDFENVLNAHLIKQGNDQYCCCDEGNKCSENITFLKSMFDCTRDCQTYFMVYVQDCKKEATCTTIKTLDFPHNSPFALASLVFLIPLGQSTSNNEVSIKH